MLRHAPTLVLLLSLGACGPDYSPDTYATNAVQQANKVEQGVVIGVRDVAVSASGTVGTVTGAAAGGIAGSQVGVGPVSAFTALGGTLVGGITGSAIEHASGDVKAFEYIVRKTGNDLVSVTQKDKAPLSLGQRVLVIAGNQARVVPDYTVPAGLAEKARVADASADPERTDVGRAAATSSPAAVALAPSGGAAAEGGPPGGGGPMVAQVPRISSNAESGNPEPTRLVPDAPIQLAQPAPGLHTTDTAETPR